jgi:glycosyltransferase involved in cell wall biosynthesis
VTDVGAAPRRPGGPVAVLTHPSADLYGSDRLLLESVTALIGGGWVVHVVLPAPGPLVDEVTARGGRVRMLDTPVLRRGLLAPRGLASLAMATAVAAPAMVRLLRELDPDVLYVNTITQPLWSLVGRALRLPTLCHVHEAEEEAPRLARLALALPLLVPHLVVANSEATRGVITGMLPALGGRTTVVYNGVTGPSEEPNAPDVTGNGVVLVGRLSWRKGSDVALEAVAKLRRAGRDVRLELCGSTFTGNEAFEAALHERSTRADLAGAVTFTGFTSPVWPALARASVVVVPSTTESFGNTAVEGQLARRPVIASDVQALRETIRSGESGLLVPPRDADALAAAIARVLDDPALATALAAAGRASALARFTPEHFRAGLLAAVDTLVARRRRTGTTSAPTAA